MQNDSKLEHPRTKFTIDDYSSPSFSPVINRCLNNPNISIRKIPSSNSVGESSSSSFSRHSSLDDTHKKVKASLEFFKIDSEGEKKFNDLIDFGHEKVPNPFSKQSSKFKPSKPKNRGKNAVQKSKQECGAQDHVVIKKKRTSKKDHKTITSSVALEHSYVERATTLPKKNPPQKSGTSLIKNSFEHPKLTKLGDVNITQTASLIKPNTTTYSDPFDQLKRTKNYYKSDDQPGPSTSFKGAAKVKDQFRRPTKQKVYPLANSKKTPSTYKPIRPLGKNCTIVRDNLDAHVEEIRRNNQQEAEKKEKGSVELKLRLDEVTGDFLIDKSFEQSPANREYSAHRSHSDYYINDISLKQQELFGSLQDYALESLTQNVMRVVNERYGDYIMNELDTFLPTVKDHPEWREVYNMITEKPAGNVTNVNLIPRNAPAPVRSTVQNVGVNILNKLPASNVTKVNLNPKISPVPVRSTVPNVGVNNSNKLPASILQKKTYKAYEMLIKKSKENSDIVEVAEKPKIACNIESPISKKTLQIFEKSAGKSSDKRSNDTTSGVKNSQSQNDVSSKMFDLNWDVSFYARSPVYSMNEINHQVDSREVSKNAFDLNCSDETTNFIETDGEESSFENPSDANQSIYMAHKVGVKNSQTQIEADSKIFDLNWDASCYEHNPVYSMNETDHQVDSREVSKNCSELNFSDETTKFIETNAGVSSVENPSLVQWEVDTKIGCPVYSLKEICQNASVNEDIKGKIAGNVSKEKLCPPPDSLNLNDEMNQSTRKIEQNCGGNNNCEEEGPLATLEESGKEDNTTTQEFRKSEQKCFPLTDIVEDTKPMDSCVKEVGNKILLIDHTIQNVSHTAASTVTEKPRKSIILVIPKGATSIGKFLPLKSHNSLPSTLVTKFALAMANPETKSKNIEVVDLTGHGNESPLITDKDPEEKTAISNAETQSLGVVKVDESSNGNTGAVDFSKLDCIVNPKQEPSFGRLLCIPLPSNIAETILNPETKPLGAVKLDDSSSGDTGVVDFTQVDGIPEVIHDKNVKTFVCNKEMDQPSVLASRDAVTTAIKIDEVTPSKESLSSLSSKLEESAFYDNTKTELALVPDQKVCFKNDNAVVKNSKEEHLSDEDCCDILENNCSYSAQNCEGEDIEKIMEDLKKLCDNKGPDEIKTLKINPKQKRVFPYDMFESVTRTFNVEIKPEANDSIGNGSFDGDFKGFSTVKPKIKSEKLECGVLQRRLREAISHNKRVENTKLTKRLTPMQRSCDKKTQFSACKVTKFKGSKRGNNKVIQRSGRMVKRSSRSRAVRPSKPNLYRLARRMHYEMEFLYRFMKSGELDVNSNVLKRVIGSCLKVGGSFGREKKVRISLEKVQKKRKTTIDVNNIPTKPRKSTGLSGNLNNLTTPDTSTVEKRITRSKAAKSSITTENSPLGINNTTQDSSADKEPSTSLDNIKKSLRSSRKKAQLPKLEVVLKETSGVTMVKYQKTDETPKVFKRTLRGRTVLFMDKSSNKSASKVGNNQASIDEAGCEVVTFSKKGITRKRKTM